MRYISAAWIECQCAALNMRHCKVDLNTITVVNVAMHLIEAIAILAAVPDQYSVLSYLDLRFVALTDSV